MTVADMKNYLAMAINLERDAYTQKKAMESIRNQTFGLGVYRNFKEPEEPDKTVNERGFEAYFWGRLLIPVCVISLVLALLFSSDFLLICGGGGLLICGGACIIGKLIYDDDYQKEMKEYNKKVEEYKKCLVDDAKRVDAERVKDAALESSYSVLRSANEKTKNCLQQLYSKNVLYPKYRNYACVCTLYEYFDSGRCTTLEGHEGAYNLLENEMRLNRIITQNDRILENLETVKQNQELLYESIQEGNQKADQIIRGCNHMSNQLNGIQMQGAELNARVAQLQTTSALNLYVNECSRRELEYINRANRIF